MDPPRLSHLTSLFSRRHTRRDTIRYSGLGLGAVAIGSTGLGQTALAQDATPATTADEEALGLPEGERTYTMFVQTARAGTWEAKDGEEGVYTLTLTGLPAQTVYFSDRPSRVVGTQSTADFLKALGFVPENPPNAALVTKADDGEDDILVIELFNPVYTEDETGATLVYDARVLANYHETGLGRIALEQDDTAIPANFDGASLFIDDCSDGRVRCMRNGNYMGTVTWGCCYKFPDCHSCHGESSPYADLCVRLPGCEDGQCGQGLHSVPCSILNW